MIKWMDMEHLHGVMVKDMKDNKLMIRNKEMVHLHGQMVESI